MINLLPPARLTNLRIARNNTVLRRYVELTIVGIAILAAAVIGAHYLLRVQQENTQKTADINQAKIESLESVQKQAEQLSLTINTIAGLMSQNVKFSDTLVEIGGRMPEGSVLTGLQFSIEDFKSPLVISAKVDSESKAAVLRNNLASSKLFSKAEIQNIVVIKDEDNNQTSDPTNAEAAQAEPSPYKYTTTINAYFKDQVGPKQ